MPIAAVNKDKILKIQLFAHILGQKLHHITRPPSQKLISADFYELRDEILAGLAQYFEVNLKRRADKNILAMDLGKSKTVVCEYDSKNGKHKYYKVLTSPQKIHV